MAVRVNPNGPTRSRALLPPAMLGLGLLAAMAGQASVSGNLCCIRNVQRGSCKYWGKTGSPKYGPPSCEGKVKVWTGPKQYGCNPCCAGTWQEECATCSCSKCNPLTEYESEAPTFRTDRKCSTCANLQCPTGKYRTGTCGDDGKGYICKACDNLQCAGEHEYRAGSCGGSTTPTANAYTCDTHQPCPKDTEYIPSDATHRMCPQCPPGQHQPLAAHRQRNCIDTTTLRTTTATATTTTTVKTYDILLVNVSCSASGICRAFSPPFFIFLAETLLPEDGSYFLNLPLLVFTAIISMPLLSHLPSDCCHSLFACGFHLMLLAQPPRLLLLRKQTQPFGLNNAQGSLPPPRTSRL